jgi:hypothetical protein
MIMGYCTDDGIVRVDFFKSSGKWYATEALRWTGSYKGSLDDSFATALRNQLGLRYNEMDAVCLEPYHENAHPICIRNGEWLNLDRYPDNGSYLSIKQKISGGYGHGTLATT